MDFEPWYHQLHQLKGDLFRNSKRLKHIETIGIQQHTSHGELAPCSFSFKQSTLWSSHQDTNSMSNTTFSWPFGCVMMCHDVSENVACHGVPPNSCHPWNLGDHGIATSPGARISPAPSDHTTIPRRKIHKRFWPHGSCDVTTKNDRQIEVIIGKRPYVDEYHMNHMDDYGWIVQNIKHSDHSNHFGHKISKFQPASDHSWPKSTGAMEISTDLQQQRQPQKKNGRLFRGVAPVT